MEATGIERIFQNIAVRYQNLADTFPGSVSVARTNTKIEKSDMVFVVHNILLAHRVGAVTRKAQATFLNLTVV